MPRFRLNIADCSAVSFRCIVVQYSQSLLFCFVLNISLHIFVVNYNGLSIFWFHKCHVTSFSTKGKCLFGSLHDFWQDQIRKVFEPRREKTGLRGF